MYILLPDFISRFNAVSAIPLHYCISFWLRPRPDLLLSSAERIWSSVTGKSLAQNRQKRDTDASLVEKIILTINNGTYAYFDGPRYAMGPVTSLAKMANGIPRDPGCLDTSEGNTKDKKENIHSKTGKLLTEAR